MIKLTENKNIGKQMSEHKPFLFHFFSNKIEPGGKTQENRLLPDLVIQTEIKRNIA